MIDKIKTQDKSPSFYKNYSDLFSRYFKKVLKEQIEDVSKAGYFYYHSVLSLDTIVDDGTNLRYIQHLLRHSSSKTTEIYTHAAVNFVKKFESPLDSLTLA